MVLSYGLTIEFTEIIWKATVKRAFPTKRSRIVSSLGWKAGAMMTPVMMGLLAFPFFGAVIFGGLDSQKALLVAVYDGDSKRKGKAAIDVLGARLGKSGAALAQQVLVVLFGAVQSLSVKFEEKSKAMQASKDKK
eukprot:gene30261-39480_t